MVVVDDDDDDGANDEDDDNGEGGGGGVLHPHLDRIEGMTDDDAHAPGDASGDEVAR